MKLFAPLALALRNEFNHFYGIFDVQNVDNPVRTQNVCAKAGSLGHKLKI